MINQTWTPIYELVNVFDTFLPQLLTYPNPKDPLNPDAASLLNTSQEEYEIVVRQMVRQFAGGPGDNPPPLEEKRPGHKGSTDIEDHLSAELSGAEGLSELSDTSGIWFEEDLF